jgi:hypothetical protein
MTNNLSIENNPKLGFYTVGDQIYYSKVQALIAGTKFITPVIAYGLSKTLKNT